jgi:hypothetical protein
MIFLGVALTARSFGAGVGVILFNQVIGPLGAKYLINYAQEGGKGKYLTFSHRLALVLPRCTMHVIVYK